MDDGELLGFVQEHALSRHVVLTGGEPMLQKGLPAFSRALRALGYHVTVETAGTVYAELDVDLYSISPKLTNSTPAKKTRFLEWHDARRIDIAVLKRLMAAGDHQLKFVVSAPSDVDEVAELAQRLGAERQRVLLMPEGRDVASLDATASWLVPECSQRGYVYCDRLQIRLFGDTRGT
jgi:7-carboxy-7-deazaguanine synthase